MTRSKYQHSKNQHGIKCTEAQAAPAHRLTVAVQAQAGFSMEVSTVEKRPVPRSLEDAACARHACRSKGPQYSPGRQPAAIAVPGCCLLLLMPWLPSPLRRRQSCLPAPEVQPVLAVIIPCTH